MGKTVLSYIIDCAKIISNDICLILGDHNKAPVLFENKNIKYFIQENPRGTGDALNVFYKPMEKYLSNDDLILVLLGDVPLVKESTLQGFIEDFKNRDLYAGFISTLMEDPGHYGRVIRNERQDLYKIKEYKFLEDHEKAINEINTGIFLFKAGFLRNHIQDLKPHKEAKGEYFITDLIEIAGKNNKRYDCYRSSDNFEFHGINTLQDLTIIRKEIGKRINEKHQMNGVDIIDPVNTYIDIDVKIENDVIIGPYNIIKGKSIIKNGVNLGPSNYIENSIISNETKVLGYSYICDSKIGKKTCIGPFAHLRLNNNISDNCRIGNFVEIKKSRIDSCSKVPHLSYIGDADIGKSVNIGAGVITCNYDGIQKHQTIINDNAFIGSDSQLVAPITIGENAYIASGSTIVSDVPSFSLSIARSKQTNKKDWVKKREEWLSPRDKGKNSSNNAEK